MERLTPLAASLPRGRGRRPDARPWPSARSPSSTGPAPDFEEFLAAIRGRLPLIPRYRQRLRHGAARPGRSGVGRRPGLRPALARPQHRAPGARRATSEVAGLISRVMTRRMDRGRPLWEYWFCEGLADGRWALLSKLHHSLVDGVSGTDLYQLVLDPTPTPRPAVPDTWQPAAPASTLAFTAARGAGAGDAPRSRPAPRSTPAAGRAAAAAAHARPPRPRGPAGADRRRCARCTHTSLTGPLDGQPPLRLDRRLASPTSARRAARPTASPSTTSRWPR